MTATALSAAPAPARAPERRRHLTSVPTGAEVRLRPTSGRPTTLRMTRRGRLVVTGLVAGAGLALGVTVLPAGAAPAGAEVTVESGQTLSEIAAVHLPDMPMDDAVTAIVVANQLQTAQVHAGQELVIPTE